MHLKILQFADYAALTRENKLVIAGTFDALTLRRRPDAQEGADLGFTMRASWLVFSVECSLSEGTEHQAVLRVMNGNGTQVHRFEIGVLQFTLNPHGRPMLFNGNLELTGLPLPGPDDYVFEFLIDGHQVGSTTLYVVEERLEA